MQFNLRAALEPADLLGEPLERGDRIVVLQGAANHDPARFENPDRLDLRRDPNAPLSFGWGIHHCIGAPLARMEGEIAFNALLERFPSIALTGEEPHWRPSFTLARPAGAAAAGVNRLSRRPLPIRAPRSHSGGGPIADASGPNRST